MNNNELNNINPSIVESWELLEKVKKTSEEKIGHWRPNYPNVFDEMVCIWTSVEVDPIGLPHKECSVYLSVGNLLFCDYETIKDHLTKLDKKGIVHPTWENKYWRMGEDKRTLEEFLLILKDQQEKYLERQKNIPSPNKLIEHSELTKKYNEILGVQ